MAGHLGRAFKVFHRFSKSSERLPRNHSLTIEFTGGRCNSAMLERPLLLWQQSTLLESRRPKGDGLMATQTTAFPDDHQPTGDVGVVRQRFDPYDSSDGPQRRIKLGTNHNCLQDSERIISICAAVKIVLDFIRTAQFRDLALPFRDGAEDLESRAALESAVDELELLRKQLYTENLAPQDEVDRVSTFEEIVGMSPALQAALSRVVKVAATDSTVLITGETGTGKELVARAIHRRSRRASRAFVAVNCAAIPRDLIPSELYGHEKGAFTGALQRRLGRFELADGGTIFLDEVGELSYDTQVALLRVLQEREFERVGGQHSIRVDVRVIAATNRDLNEAVADGTFRQDLFYRLNVFPLEMPPLRERQEDIAVLVEYFVDRYARKAGKTIRRISKRTLDRLKSYPWPGNVRELQNVIERSVIVSDTDEFTVDESWLSTRPAVESRLGMSGALASHEKALIEDALRATGGRVFGPSGAAERLGIPRSTLESKIRSLKINKSRFRARAPKRS